MFDDKKKLMFLETKVSRGESFKGRMRKAYSVTKNTFKVKERMYYEKGNEQQRFLAR